MISDGSSDSSNGIALDNFFSFLPGMAYRCANDSDWTMFTISPGSFELTGYTPDEFINQLVSFDSLILPEYRKKVWNAIQDAINTRHPFTMEYRIHTKSGDEKWVWEKGAGIYDDEGNLLFLEGYITDITVQKEREFEFNTFFDIQPDLLCIATIGGTLLRVNRAWERTIGFSVEELQGRSFIEFVYPDDLEKTLNIAGYVSDDGIISSFRNRYLTKSGEVVTLDWRAAIKNDKYYAVARDVSQQIKLQESVKENAGVLKSLVNSITESAILIEIDGTVVISNLITAERLKRPGEDLSGKNIFELLEPETAEYRRKKVDEVIRKKASVQFEGLRFGSNILNSIYPVFDENGDVSRLAIFGFDITHRKHSIRELEALSNELRDMNERKNKFISILAHDLRGPFHPLLNSLDLLHSDYELFTEDERKQFIKSSYEIAQTQFALLESILEWSRATQGKLRINAERFLISTTIQKAIAQVSSVFESKNILIKFTPSEEFFAIADTEMTITVIRNLLSNAAKFSDVGSQVWINQKATDKTIEVSVIDNGRGIESESLNKLFDISQTRSSRGTFNEKGSGLGLLLCKELLEKMHGTIAISSELGMGTIVTFTLPRGLSI